VTGVRVSKFDDDIIAVSVAGVARVVSGSTNVGSSEYLVSLAAASRRYFA